MNKTILLIILFALSRYFLARNKKSVFTFVCLIIIICDIDLFVYIYMSNRRKHLLQYYYNLLFQQLDSSIEAIFAAQEPNHSEILI